MTHHNISHSEAGRPIAHIQIRRMRARRRRPQLGLRAKLAGMGALGVVASLLDSLLGAPVFLTIGGLALLCWCFQPDAD